MSLITYNTKLVFSSPEDKKGILNILEAQRLAWNECSKIKFEKVPKNSIVDLHKVFYRQFRDKHPEIPSQIVISAERFVLVAYRRNKSNRRIIKEPYFKKELSMRLDNCSFSCKKVDNIPFFSIVSFGKRIKCQPYIYPKLREYLDKYKFCPPDLFVRNNEVFVGLGFEIPELACKQTLAVGIDLGIRNNAVTSEGVIYRDKQFNKEKRALRFNKRKFQTKSKISKSAKRHLKQLRRKERNKNKDFTHKLVNSILRDTKADIIVLEDLKGLKKKKNKFQNKNRISQISFAELRRIITYKAALLKEPKTVIVVSPSYSSQIDHRTGLKDGIRNGSRYTGKDGQVLHADCNAACNLALRSKHPCSISDYFAWQAAVRQPNGCLKASNAGGSSLVNYRV